MSNSQFWRDEFGASYAVPDVILTEPGIEDISWRNDIAPSFTYTAVADAGAHDPQVDLRLWVEHPDPHMRECGPAAPRFSVSLDSDELYAGDDVDAALTCLRRNRDGILARRAKR